MNSTKNISFNSRLRVLIVIFIAVLIDFFVSKKIAQLSYQWLPIQASTAAPYVDNLFALETGLGAFIFLGCTSVIAWVLIFNRASKYDETDGKPIEGNITIEIIWTVVPLVIVLGIAIYSTRINSTLQNLGSKQKYNIEDSIPSLNTTAISDVGPIDVISKQWNWEFIYPEGLHSSELHLPENHRVTLRLISEDVIHSFYVPAFRLKQDIIPGSVIYYSLTPTRAGIYRLRDAMFSGAYFSQNQTNVIVESNDSYRDWISKTVKKEPQEGLNNARRLYKRRLEKGDKGWATVSPAPSPLVNDPGNPFAPHES